MDDIRTLLQEQREFQKQQTSHMATMTELLTRLATQNINNNTPNPSQPSSSSSIPSQPLPNPKGGLNAITLRSGTQLEEVIPSAIVNAKNEEEDVVVEDVQEEVEEIPKTSGSATVKTKAQKG
ncbi:hypothetical protein PIB30_095246 [Stylosanthes scabra]|uniref:Uncharacterized protein n=1 Tax=Stylosanthes scabra TaxID=79078 RepID=A0ABU6SX02_9FABA|nr:hypothetical protein [Stylosanthes scabra]